MLWLFALVIGIVYFYIVKIKPLLYWKEKGVKQTSFYDTFLLLLPNWLRVNVFTKPTLDIKNDLYKNNPNERYVGRYTIIANSGHVTKYLLIKDVDLIKKVTIKNFENFTDHDTLIPPGRDPIWDKNLFALKGEPWRDMRSTLSPTFTGSKMRNIYMVVDKVAKQMTEHFLNQKKDFFQIEAKDLFTRFTNDVIATTAFGIEVDSFKNPENDFYITGVETTAIANPTKRSKFVRKGVFPEHTVKFFKSIIKQTLEYREKNNIERSDVLELLIKTKKNQLQEEENINTAQEGFSIHQEEKLKGKKLQLSDDDVAAQSLIFFFAGFDTVSTAMTYTSYELALNQDVQQKLYEEITATWEQTKGKLTYEDITKMVYMDMVISEVLRKWPPTENLTRLCTKTFTIEPTKPGEQPFVVPAGTSIEIPVWQIQRDPQYYPEPDRFNPERFSKENKDKIKPCTYMPFGSGPRICIGNRLALLEIKIAFFYLLRHFVIEPVADTPIPIKVHPLSSNLTIAYPCPLGLKLRKL